MKKEELEKKLESIEKELKKLKEILDTDSEEYAKKLNERQIFKCKFTESDTYPYRIGIASTTIKIILEEI